MGTVYVLMTEPSQISLERNNCTHRRLSTERVDACARTSGAYIRIRSEGAVVSQLDDQPPQTYTTGQMWSEAPHQHHVVSKNASATAAAKLLVFMIAPHGQNLTKFLPAK